MLSWSTRRAFKRGKFLSCTSSETQSSARNRFFQRKILWTIPIGSEKQYFWTIEILKNLERWVNDFQKRRFFSFFSKKKFIFRQNIFKKKMHLTILFSSRLRLLSFRWNKSEDIRSLRRKDVLKIGSHTLMLTCSWSLFLTYIPFLLVSHAHALYLPHTPAHSLSFSVFSFNLIMDSTLDPTDDKTPLSWRNITNQETWDLSNKSS